MNIPDLFFKLLESKIYSDVTVYDLLVFFIVVTIAVVIAKFVRMNLKKMLSDKIPRSELDLILKMVYYGIIFVAVVSVMPQIGVNLSGLLVAGGIVGLVVGFASQSVVANFVSGLFLMFERPIKIGDQVKIGDISGFVEDIKILSTVIRTYDGVYVRIPNEKVFTSDITNFVANAARRFEYVVGISYNDDAERAIEVIRKVIDEHPFTLRNPPPKIFVSELGDSSVNIEIRVWVPSIVWRDVRKEILWKIKAALDKEGIEIPFPQRVVWFANKLEGGVKVEYRENVSS